MSKALFIIIIVHMSITKDNKIIASDITTSLEAVTTKVTAVDSKLGNYLPLSGGTMTGQLNLGGHTINKVRAMELYGTTDGGIVDFHFNDPDADFTSRITENAEGSIDISAPNGLTHNGNSILTSAGGTLTNHLYMSNKTLYWVSGIEMRATGHGHGGVIDFHFDGTDVDYTSRIIENAEGRLSITAPNGLYWNGKELATTDIPLYPSTTPVPAVSHKICAVRASSDIAPNNGAILSYYNNESWWGQLFFGDNANQGVYYRGCSNGEVGEWKRLLDSVSNVYVTATYSSGTNWYRKWSDGWIEQGGTTQNVGSDSTVTVSCITAFTTTNYNIVASQKSNGTKTDSTGMVLLYPTSTSSWRLHNGDNVSAPFMWYACGK